MQQQIKESLGLIHVYTGNGKGKTTAALGLSLRALEHGLSVHMIQFLKGGSYSGELLTPRRFSGRFCIEQFGKGSEDKPEYEDFEADENDRQRALRALNRAEELLGKVDVLVLDEINVALHLGHLQLGEVLGLIENKPDNLELVFTGRSAHEDVLGAADYVTEMKGHKHPYNKGILGRRGIDY